MTFANKITILRILLVPFFIATILDFSPEKDHLRFTALAIFLLAAVTDAIDGYIARRWHQKTQAGAILDPLADKIMLISAFICIYVVSASFDVLRFPVWLVVAVISRDVILLLGTTIIYLVHRKLTVEPSRWGKVNTFFQICCIVGMLLQWPFSSIFWYLTLITVAVSGVGYIRNGIKIINNGGSGVQVTGRR